MYVDNLPSIYCARPSVIGQRLVNIIAYINQLEGISNLKEDAVTILWENQILSNIIGYNNILIDT